MYKNLTNPRSSRATFRTAGIVENGEDREERYNGDSKDDDVDNRNIRAGTRGKRIPYLLRPDVCVSDWLEGLAHIPLAFSHFLLHS